MTGCIKLYFVLVGVKGDWPYLSHLVGDWTWSCYIYVYMNSMRQPQCDRCLHVIWLFKEKYTISALGSPATESAIIAAGLKLAYA